MLLIEGVSKPPNEPDPNSSSVYGSLAVAGAKEPSLNIEDCSIAQDSHLHASFRQRGRAPSSKGIPFRWPLLA